MKPKGLRKSARQPIKQPDSLLQVIQSFPPVRSLTHSNRTTFASCRKKFLWDYQYRLSTQRVSEPLEVGSVFHDEIDKFYCALRDEGRYGEEGIFTSQKRIADHFQRMRAGIDATIISEYDYDRIAIMEAVCCGLVAGYVRKYEERDLANYEVVEPETQFELPIGDTGWFTRGKIDLLVRVKKRKKVYRIIEHKTASSITPGYVSKIALDKQTLRYVMAARKVFKLNVDSIVYNVTMKPRIRQGKRESFTNFVKRMENEYEDETKYFYREVITPSDKMVRSIEVDDLKFVKEIERSQESGYYYQNTGHCFDFNSTCPYMRLCVEGANEDTLAGYRVRDRVHEELN